VNTEANFDTLHDICAGKHFYQFYKNIDDFLQVMIPFFQAGIEKREACLWIVSERIGLTAARDTAEALIPFFTAHLESGLFRLIAAEEWYLTEGAFDKEKAMASAADYLDQVLKTGFHRLRAAGDGAAIPRADWEKFQDYEREIAVWIKGQPVIALCAYPILECTPTQTKSILEAHDDVLVGHL
jgi:hypothetical protein